MTTDVQFLTVVRYIVNNPVEAGLCAAPEAWPWSSHGAILRGDAPAWLGVSRLFAYLGAYGGNPLDRYAELF